MEVSERTIRFLGKTLCGDNKILPYKSGPQLVDLFNQFGADDVYGEGFPSRWKYTEDSVRELNGTLELKLLIENCIDPRDLIEAGAEPEALDEIIKPINEYLRFEGFEIKKIGDFYKIHDSKGIVVQPETVKKLNHEFIQEQVTKCHSKIDQGDFNGAITNARSLAEAVMIEIIEQYEGKEIKNDGKLENLYKQVKKIMNLTIEPDIFPSTVIQILSGLDSIIGGLAGLSNNSGDRHANKFKTRKHHARLAVNATMTMVDFLLDSRDYQKKNNSLS